MTETLRVSLTPKHMGALRALAAQQKRDVREQASMLLMLAIERAALEAVKK